MPVLTSSTALHSHFNWLIDGDIKHLIEKNLSGELSNLELYLRSEGRVAVLKELEESAMKGDTLYSEAGSLFKLIGVLRAADIFWNEANKPVLFHLDGEPLEGDGPRILIKPRRDGYVLTVYITSITNFLSHSFPEMFCYWYRYLCITKKLT